MTSTHHSGFRLECELHNGFSPVQQPCRAASSVKERKTNPPPKKPRTCPDVQEVHALVLQLCRDACGKGKRNSAGTQICVLLIQTRRMHLNAKAAQRITEHLRLAEVDLRPAAGLVKKVAAKWIRLLYLEKGNCVNQRDACCFYDHGDGKPRVTNKTTVRSPPTHRHTASDLQLPRF